ncbi:MAG TPA: ABC transporter substrate-binding protein [Terriglobales bacterium]|nr:ABC transporter substrate-binding protein [Terriglobales bacterium]
MKRTAFRLLAAASLWLVALGAASAEERPRYGGTLRVQMKEAVLSFDPTDDKELTAARTRLAFLIFDRLTQIDDQGRVRPQLAWSWTSDAEHKTWRFTLRSGVLFHDGTQLSGAHVVGHFARANDPRWQVRLGNGPQVVVFECANPIYDLPAILASPRYSVVLHAEKPEGTGPFRVESWQPGRQLLLAANLDYFEGRPYLDAVDIQMGNSLRDQVIDARLDRDELLEVDIEQALRLQSARQRVDTSSPSRLLALVFRTQNPALRELLARSIDRNAIHAAILKKSGSPAVSLLPQWLTGYAVLMNDVPDPARLQKLRSDLSKAAPLYLAFDPSDPLNKAIADRIAVNARDVGLTVQVFGEKNLSASSRADALLFTFPAPSANSTQALIELAEAAQVDQNDVLSAGSPEDLFVAEDSLLGAYRVAPIAHLPVTVWLSTRIRNWKTLPEGRWRLEQVWLDSVK